MFASCLRPLFQDTHPHTHGLSVEIFQSQNFLDPKKNCPVITTVTIKKKKHWCRVFHHHPLSARYYGTTETSSLQHHPSDPVQSRGIRTILAIQQAVGKSLRKILRVADSELRESWINKIHKFACFPSDSIIYLVMYKLYHILLQRKQKRPTANVPHLHEKGRETYNYNSANQPFSQHRTKISPSTSERPWCEHSQSRRQRSRWPTARPLGKAVGCHHEGWCWVVDGKVEMVTQCLLD